MKKLIVANWKMHPQTLAEAEELIEHTEARLVELGPAAERIDIVLCPPFVFTEEAAKLIGQGILTAVALGAQDVAAAEVGSQTGEVSAAQLSRLGVRYVIVGHSERRWKLGEDDGTVNTKLKTVLRAGMIPIVCLGERSREGNWQEALSAQTAGTFNGMMPQEVARCLIAYEPVWAISTNPGAMPDTPPGAVRAMGVIREVIADRFDAAQPALLYGGSVTPENVGSFLARAEIAGVLVGGASVRADDFSRILSIAAGALHEND
jgi:triosephosphate isomerase